MLLCARGQANAFEESARSSNTIFSLLGSAYLKTRAFDIRRGDKSPTTFPKASINLVFTHRERMKSFRTFNLPLHDSKEGRPCSLGMNLCLV